MEEMFYLRGRVTGWFGFICVVNELQEPRDEFSGSIEKSWKEVPGASVAFLVWILEVNGVNRR